ncbi:hypothetical protein JOB18_021264 [Solea senegalensis]|uniref:Uncharacterized protein n=1 Tax=Solea senegalensis TaxID=28829 RepID=A0AAV6RXY0_SOLSE|nr:hypothetical protein JOB18_021264 [Solea senegalensis]
MLKGKGPSQQPHDDDDDDYDDEETLTGRDSELQDDIRAIYKRYLLHATEYKRLQIKKIKLEIRKMEKDPDLRDPPT